ADGAATEALCPFLSRFSRFCRLSGLAFVLASLLASLPGDGAACAGAAVSSARETAARAAPPATITSARRSRALLKTRTGSRELFLFGFCVRVRELDLAGIVRPLAQQPELSGGDGL